MRQSAYRIGVIADTHGLFRPQIPALFQGVDWILHAGDLGKAEVLEHLRAIAPVTAVRGNVDHGAWADAIAEREILVLLGRRFLLQHLAPAAPWDGNPDVIVSGHSHRPTINRLAKVLLLNPGSAGPRRFSLPVSVALITIRRTRLDAELIYLS